MASTFGERIKMNGEEPHVELLALQRVRDGFCKVLSPMGFRIVSEHDDPDIKEFYRNITFDDGTHKVYVTFDYLNACVGVLLSRRLKIGGREFQRTLSLEHLREWRGKSEERKRLFEFLDSRTQLRDNLDETLSILRQEGIAWLRGDYSREPYIPTNIDRIQEPEQGTGGNAI